MKTYEVTYDRKKNKGVYAISLVDNPAMEALFVKLSKQDKVIQLKSIDEEKRELIGVVLEPNKPIYRNKNGEEYNIIFSDEVIKELLIGFAQNGNQNNSTIEHKEILRLKGVTFYENWIVEDEENDKSNKYDLKAKKGSWVAKLKIDNEGLWSDFIKTGLLKGFSIEAMVNIQEIKLNNMNKVELNDETKVWLTSLFESFMKVKEEPVALKEETVKLEEKKEVEKNEEKIEQEEEAPILTEEMKSEIMEMIKTAISEMKSGVDEEMKKVQGENVAMKAELKAELKAIGKQPVSSARKSAPSSPNVNQNKSLVEFLNENHS